MNVNYEYFAHYVRSHASGRKPCRVLDYGCGDGKLVSALRAQGVDCWGTEAFYEGGTYRDPGLERLLDEKVIRHIADDGWVPFEDHAFDLIFSNQVLEHVEDLSLVVKEFTRLLAHDGVMYHHFPSREVWREGHLGVPWVHRIRHRRARFIYTVVLHRAGMGHNRDIARTSAEWAARSLRWLDDYVVYRPYRDIRAAFEPGFMIRHREIDYVRFRTQARPLLSRVADTDVLVPACERLFRRLGFMAIELTRKRGEAVEPVGG